MGVVFFAHHSCVQSFILLYILNIKHFFIGRLCKKNALNIGGARHRKKKKVISDKINGFFLKKRFQFVNNKPQNPQNLLALQKILFFFLNGIRTSSGLTFPLNVGKNATFPGEA